MAEANISKNVLNKQNLFGTFFCALKGRLLYVQKMYYKNVSKYCRNVSNVLQLTCQMKQKCFKDIKPQKII